MSDKIIDFEERKALKDCSPNLTQKIMGERWFTYLLDFDHGGDIYSVRLMAKSLSDANERLASLKANGRIEGQLMDEVI